MTFAATESATAGGLVGPRRRRLRHSAKGDNDGEDVLSPLIVNPTPRMSKPVFSNNVAGANASTGVGPYSLNSPPPRISSTRSQIEHLGAHHSQIHNQLKIEDRDDDDDSKSKTSFLSNASKKLKKKLAAKQGRKSWHGEGWSDHHRDNGNDDDENKNIGTLVNDYNTTDDIPFFEVEKSRNSNARVTKEARDPSPTHDDGDDDEYYNNYSDRPDRQRQSHHSYYRHRCGRHDFKEEEVAEVENDDGEYTHNDGSTLSTNSIPARPTPLRGHVYGVRVPYPQDEVMEKKNIEKYCDDINETFEIQSEWLRTDDNKQEKATLQRQRQQQHWKGGHQQQHRQGLVQYHRRRRDHPPLLPLDIVVGSSWPQSPGGKCVEESPKPSGDVQRDEVQEVHEPMIRQPHGTDLGNQCRILREVVTNNTSKTIEIQNVVDVDVDDEKRGPTSFAERKKIIMNSLNLVPYQKKESHTKQQLLLQQAVTKEIPPDVVQKEEDSHPLLTKRNGYLSNANRSSVMNELINKFGEKDNRMDPGKVNGRPNQKRNINHLSSPFHNSEKQHQHQVIAAEVLTGTIVEKRNTSPRSNGHKSKESTRRSGIMAELISKFGTEEDALHVKQDGRGFEMNSNASHHDSPSTSKPWSGRNNNGTQDMPSSTQILISASSNHNTEEILRENECLSFELQRMKEKLSKREREMDSKITKLERALHEQEQEVETLREDKVKSEAKDDSRLQEYISQLTADLDSYKVECASYRERILQKEREIARMENFLYEEKKKVLSLESETQMLLNIAEDNVSHATSTNRETELAAYRDECDKYRKRVLELERKVLAAEGALDSTGYIASALEEEKNSMSAQLILWQSDNVSLKAENETLRSKLDEKDSKIQAIEFELSALQSRWSAEETNIMDAKGDADENRKSMSILERENASLMQKLEKLQTIVNRCNQVEEENLALKKLHIDVTERHAEMSKEVLDARGLASNTARLQKTMQDNESYISQLQDELAKERATHLESIQNSRQKYTAEITALTEKLRAAEESTRIAEMKNYELDGKLVTVEREQSELRELEAHQTKSQRDQMMKLMEHADDLRRKNMELQGENVSLKSGLSEKEHTHCIRVKELQSELSALETERSKIANSLVTIKMELIRTSDEKKEEVDALGQEKAKLEVEFANLSSENATCIESLQLKVQQLEHSLEDVTTCKTAFEEQVYTLKRNVADALSAIRKEETALLTDIQNRMLDERVEMMKQVKEVACKFWNEVEKKKLDNSLRHSVAMSVICSEKSDLERSLWTEKEKTSSLTASLAVAQEDKKILANVCAKLSVGEKESLVDAIDDIILDSSNAKFHAKTLEVDVSDLTSKHAELEDKTALLTSQLQENECLVRKLEVELKKGLDTLGVQLEDNTSLKEKLETQRAEAERVVEQIRSSFDADRKSQDKVVDEIISAKEEALRREQALLVKLDALTNEAADHDEQVQKLTTMLDESKQEHDDLSSKYEASRQQIVCLHDKIESSQQKADELMNHYMKIEDELRQQLQSVQGEKTSLERKLKVVQRESDRLLNELCAEKHDLTSTRASQVGLIQELEAQVDDLTRSITKTEEKCDDLSNEVADLQQRNTELIENYDAVCRERDVSFDAIADETEMHGNELKAMKLRIEEERLAHASSVAEIQSRFNIEMDRHAAHFETQEHKIHTITCEANQLGEEVERLKETKEEQKRQISQLKESLKEAVEEAQRLGQKFASEQDEVSKVTLSVASFEEENSHLKQSLERSRSKFDKVATFLGLQDEPDDSDIESSLLQIVEEKTRLENDLCDKQEKLFKTMNTLTHFELKLVRTEQERDAQSERVRSEIVRLENEVSSLVSTQQLKDTELKILFALKNEWKEKEIELKSQIAALKKDFEVEYVNNQLYRELLGGTEENAVATSSLNEELQSLREEKDRLSRDNSDIVTANEALATKVNTLSVANEQLAAENLALSENLATVKSKIHCVKSKIAVSKSDDWSMKSGDSRESHVKKAAIELQSTVKAIKKHHDETVKTLQFELDDARKRLKKYECKVCELTTLIEENAVVIESLHQKLRGKTPTHISKYTTSSPRQSYSNESEVTE